MANTDEDAMAANIPSGSPSTEVDEEEGISILDIYADAPQDKAKVHPDPGDAGVSVEHAWGSGGRSSAATTTSATTQKTTPGRKVHKEDVQHIVSANEYCAVCRISLPSPTIFFGVNFINLQFRASTTTCTVSYEQIDRIKRMHDKIDGKLSVSSFHCVEESTLQSIVTKHDNI